MLFACLISDILSNFTGCDTVITGDVTYGACCIDDLTAKQLDVDFIIHYGVCLVFTIGHSCLVPINETVVKTLYVFVEMNIDMNHAVQTILLNFPDRA
jgi:2-(3-amino-3-carboxypropyl)histidine synthase